MADIDILEEQKEFQQKFNAWFNSTGRTGKSQKDVQLDARRRYQMILKDDEERIRRKLSRLPSTKSTSVVDRAVDKALMEYHGDPNAFNFAPKTIGDPVLEQKARWLTEDFRYRCENTFPFFSWDMKSLMSGFVDGLEAAMVSWRKESYTEDVESLKHYFAGGEQGPTEVPQHVYDMGIQMSPDSYVKMNRKETKEFVTYDSFWIDQLDPGTNLYWDLNCPYLDLNLGQRCMVEIERSIDQLMEMSKSGVLDKVTEEELKKHTTKRNFSETKSAAYTTVGSIETFDFGDLNQIKVWVYFKKIKGCWQVCHSVRGELQLSTFKPVNQVFFAGRRVDKLPVVLGTSRFKLGESVGRGLPETIAPIEDEWSDHRNNINDAAKIALRGRYRLEPTSRIKIDDLINGWAFRATKGEYEKVDQDLMVIPNLRVAETINSDMSELIPVTMDSPMVVPRNSTKTLGAFQMSMGQQNEKQSVSLMVRKQTFMKPLVSLLAHLIMAFDTDDEVLKISAQNAGAQPPMVGGMIDFRELDLDFEVEINIGMGGVASQQRPQAAMQLAEWGESHGIPQDYMKIYQSMSVAIGFKPDQFINQQPAPPPQSKRDISLAIKAGWLELPPEIQQIVLQDFINGAPGKADASLSADLAEQAHNAPIGGTNTQAAPVQNMASGPEAAGMSHGGMHGSN